MKNHAGNLALLLLCIFIPLFMLSAIRPHDYFTWFMEVFPTIIVVAILVPTYRRFRLTNLVYLAIFIHALILIRGGHYTYAEEPIFNWLRDTFAMKRNYYDRLGHFAQGFVPALVAREIISRTSPVKKNGWLFFLTFCVCMTITSLYELLEWQTAVWTGTAADAFLGTQGDVWDTQWDMALCLLGALTALITLSRFHSKKIAELTTPAVEDKTREDVL